MADIETMLVKYPGSPEPVVINSCDFDPDFHQSLDPEAKAQEAEKPAPKKRGRPRKKPEAE